MSKKKTPGESSQAVDITADQQATEKSFQERIKELEDRIRAGEEAALKRVCKAMGIEEDEVRSKEKAKPAPEMLVKMFVNYPVTINGRVYKGEETVPYSVFQVISQALGDRRMRILRELTGNNYILEELAGGGHAPKLVGRVDETGERIA